MRRIEAVITFKGFAVGDDDNDDDDNNNDDDKNGDDDDDDNNDDDDDNLGTRKSIAILIFQIQYFLSYSIFIK